MAEGDLPVPQFDHPGVDARSMAAPTSPSGMTASSSSTVGSETAAATNSASWTGGSSRLSR